MLVVLFLNRGMRLAELVGMDLGDIDLEQRQIRLFGKGHKERMVYLNDACVEALLYLRKRNTMEGLSPKEKAVFITRMRKERIPEPQGRTVDLRRNEGCRTVGDCWELCGERAWCRVR